MIMDNINHYISNYEDFLVFCDPDYKNEIYKKIEVRLKLIGGLKGEALRQVMDNLKSQYETHLIKPENQINLKKFVQIASENLESIKKSPESVLVAGKLNLLLFQYKHNPGKKEFSLPFFTTLEEKAHKLELDLKGIYSKGELDNYFMTAELFITKPIKQAIKHLTPDQVKEYAKNNVFHLSESIGISNSILLEDLIKIFSEDQIKALFQGITEMKDKEQSFRQLFCCLIHARKTASIVYESFPIDYFIKYFESHLKNIQGMKINAMEKPLLALDGVIIQGRLNPIAKIVIQDAVKNNNYLRSNDLVKIYEIRIRA